MSAEWYFYFFIVYLFYFIYIAYGENYVHMLKYMSASAKYLAHAFSQSAKGVSVKCAS